MKKIKGIVEMIFIFVLPFIFISPNIIITLVESNNNIFYKQLTYSRVFGYNNFISKMYDIIINNLHITNGSSTINFILDYILIMFIMFVLWHLFYRVLDFLMHFWRRSDD